MDQCRVCLSNINLTVNIFNRSDQIYTKIMSLAKVQIQPNDGLPIFICTSCNNLLGICLNFIKLCEKSDYELRKPIPIIKEVKITTGFIKQDPSCNSSTKNIIANYDQNITVSYDQKEVKTEPDMTEKLIKSFSASKQAVKLNLDHKVSQKQQCCTCGKVMSSRFRLKTHLATHTGEKPFACPHCDKKFTIAQNLNVHIRIHTGEKPFSCTLCGKSFAQSSGLAAHKRKHTGQTPYNCVLCPRSFRTIGHLQYHVRRHTGEKNYECDTCGRAFITRSDLKQHLLTHIGEKPHVCCVCGLRLSRASNLKRHLKYTHNDGKTFVCRVCPSKFARKHDLLKHEKIHNSNL